MTPAWLTEVALLPVACASWALVAAVLLPLAGYSWVAAAAAWILRGAA